jgi:hypothetical protein
MFCQGQMSEDEAQWNTQRHLISKERRNYGKENGHWRCSWLMSARIGSRNRISSIIACVIPELSSSITIQLNWWTWRVCAIILCYLYVRKHYSTCLTKKMGNGLWKQRGWGFRINWSTGLPIDHHCNMPTWHRGHQVSDLILLWKTARTQLHTKNW